MKLIVSGAFYEISSGTMDLFEEVAAADRNTRERKGSDEQQVILRAT